MALAFFFFPQVKRTLVFDPGIFAVFIVEQMPFFRSNPGVINKALCKVLGKVLSSSREERPLLWRKRPNLKG